MIGATRKFIMVNDRMGGEGEGFVLPRQAAVNTGLSLVFYSCQSVKKVHERKVIVDMLEGEHKSGRKKK